jgi:Family of unknown function (DUF5924)
MADRDAPPLAVDRPPPGRLTRVVRKIWWLHSLVALGFGVGVMLFARHGLAYADKILMVLFLSWLLMFVALRFVVGPANRDPDEKLLRKGVRVGTNYIIKQLYQQMFFFLVPLYGSSATWSLSSVNWWMAPVLLLCAVVSTMDLVFDNVIMERRWLASLMYGLAMFGALNVVVPLVFGMTHRDGLRVASLLTPPAVALLTFSVRSVVSPVGLALTIAATAGLFAAVSIGRRAVPPAPLSMPETAVGHGSYGSYECMPPSKHVLRRTQLDGLRCGSLLVEPGGIKERVVHYWRHDGISIRIDPDRRPCDGDGAVFVSELPLSQLPADPEGVWTCVTETVGGQLVGSRRFTIVGANGTPHVGPSRTGIGTTDSPPALDGGSLDAGSLDAGSLDAGSLDAGSLDAGSLDGAPFDAGPVLKGGVPDAGPLDARGVLDARL